MWGGRQKKLGEEIRGLRSWEEAGAPPSCIWVQGRGLQGRGAAGVGRTVAAALGPSAHLSWVGLG